MAWLGIQGLIAVSIPLMPQSSLTTTKSCMCLNIRLHHSCYYYGSILCELLLEVLTPLPNWDACLLLCSIHTSWPSMIFLKCNSDPTNLFPKIFQWLPVPNSMKSKPLRMIRKFLCTQSSACLSRLISAGPLTLHLFILNDVLFTAYTKALSPWGPSHIDSPHSISYPHVPFSIWLTWVHPLGFSPESQTSPLSGRCFIWPHMSGIDRLPSFM